MSTRREPVQARSRARVDGILDAADAVFLERGFDEASTNHIAVAAGTSIGSIYRFFPDKDAILVALAERYGARMQAIAAAVTPVAPGPVPLAERVAQGIDQFNQFLRENRGYLTLIRQAHHPALRAGAAAQEAAMVALIGASQAAYAPHLSQEEVAAVAEVTQTVLSALQILSLTRDEPFREAVVAEAKVLVSAYLTQRLGAAESFDIKMSSR